jgi:dephospho-CoA kinase
MLKVGLTGGIGAGKSVVAKLFQVLDIPVYDADMAAKTIMQQDPEIKKSIIDHFGEKAYTDGHLNRSYLAEQVFSNKSKLELLNSLVHPATIRDAETWFSKQQSPYAIKEAALLFESGTAAGLDYVIGVTAPQALRISRVIKRDHISEVKVKERIKHQLDDLLKMKLCDFVIHNNEQELVIQQVIELHNILCGMSKKETHTS